MKFSYIKIQQISLVKKKIILKGAIFIIKEAVFISWTINPGTLTHHSKYIRERLVLSFFTEKAQFSKQTPNKREVRLCDKAWFSYK